MEEEDKIFKENSEKTKLANLIAKSHEKLINKENGKSDKPLVTTRPGTIIYKTDGEEKEPHKIPAVAKPGKNITLFTQETIERYAMKKDKGFEPGE